MVGRPTACLLLASAALAAQVPYGHFLVSARNTAGTGAYFLDARTGDLTPVLGLTATVPVLTNVSCGAIEPQTGDLLLSGGGPVISRQPTLYRVSLRGRTAGAATPLVLTGYLGTVADVTFAPAGQVLFCGTGNASMPGLWQILTTGGGATLLGNVADAIEVASDAQVAYVLTRRTGQPSTIWKYDYSTTAFAQAAGNLPEATAFDVFAGPLLLLGTQLGDLYLVDSGSGSSVFLRSLGGGAVTALRQMPQSGGLAIVTASGMVFDFSGSVIGTVPTTANDIDVGQLDQAVFFTYGEGCPGSNSQRPAIGSMGNPAIPNPGFAVTIANGRASSIGLHVLGYSRRNWSGVPLPLDLSSLGAPGCAILGNGVLIQFATLDGAGAAALPLPIPADLSLRSATLTHQWWVVDSTANALGLSFSEGGESVLR
jgi:hypothetical protein